jgi:hypothetical protein
VERPRMGRDRRLIDLLTTRRAELARIPAAEFEAQYYRCAV